MKFKNKFLYNYLKNAPVALAIERVLECEILSKQDFRRPILDIGCGEGLFARILFDEKIDTGIDKNKKELEKAKEYGMYKELIECGGNKIPKQSELFNTILSNSVLEHIPDVESVLKESYRLLAKGGKFYLTVPTDLFDKYSVIYQILVFCRLYNLSEKYRRFFNNFWKHFNFYSKEKWIEIFEANGFKLVEAKEYASKTTCLINDFLIPFALLSFVVKKITNRWILFKLLRSIYIYPFYFLIKNIIKISEKNNTKGGIIFFSFIKE